MKQIFLYFLIYILSQVNLWSQEISYYYYYNTTEAFTYEPETLAYKNRVEADGGEVINLMAVNSFYLGAKSNNYLDTLIVALLMNGGVKRGHDSVFVWYDLTENENDFVSGSAVVTPISAPFFNSVNGIGGNSQPAMFCTLTYNQPSAYYAVISRNNKTGYEYFWGSVGNHAFLQNGAGRGLYLHAGVDFTPAVSYTNNVFMLHRIIYAGASSSVQLNNGTVTTGNAGTTNVTAAAFSLLNTNTETYFKCFVISPRLSTSKDLALKNILNSLYSVY